MISFLRRGKDGRGAVVIVCNFTPVVRKGYRVGVPDGGFYAESLNTDAERYGGGNVGNYGGVDADGLADARPAVLARPEPAAVRRRRPAPRRQRARPRRGGGETGEGAGEPGAVDDASATP